MRIGWRTENPPDEKEEYLVQYDIGSMDIATWTNVNPFWTNKTTDWHWNKAQYCKVIAWMPLPEPYKGGNAE